MRLKRRILGIPLIGRLYLTLVHGFETQNIYPFYKINGWLSIPEAIALFRIGRNEIHSNDSVMVEIGSWQGKSTIVLAKSFLPAQAGKIYCIDPFDASGDAHSGEVYQNILDSSKISLQDRFLENIRNAKVESRVVCMKGFSRDFSKNWDKPIDFLYIDGNHDYEAVRSDFEGWSPFVKLGGTIGLHDVHFDSNGNPTGHTQGPATVVKNLITSSKAWGHFRQIESLFLAKKLAP